MNTRVARAAVIGALLAVVAGTGTVAAHESREFGEHTIVVGFANDGVHVSLQ